MARDFNGIKRQQTEEEPESDREKEAGTAGKFVELTNFDSAINFSQAQLNFSYRVSLLIEYGKYDSSSSSSRECHKCWCIISQSDRDNDLATLLLPN